MRSSSGSCADPCTPPDPCKIRLDLTVNTSVRTDLDQAVTFGRPIQTELNGEQINPCIRILHRFLGDGTMQEQVDLLGTDDHVHITVPVGFAIVPAEEGGYELSAIPQ